MCTPFLLNLTSRLAQLIEFSRSTRLKVREIVDEGLIDEQREPLCFTVNRLTAQVLEQIAEIESASVEAALWNSTTSPAVILEFQTALRESKARVIEIVGETRSLRIEMFDLPGAAEYLSPSPEFDELYQLIDNGFVDDDAEMLKLASSQVSDFLNDSAVRDAIGTRIAAFRKAR